MKIAAAVKNAQAFLVVQEEFGSFDAYCWQFVNGRPRQNRWRALRQIPATTAESDAFSRDLKRRGFSFVGSTVIYAHMQGRRHSAPRRRRRAHERRLRSGTAVIDMRYENPMYMPRTLVPRTSSRVGVCNWASAADRRNRWSTAGGISG